MIRCFRYVLILQSTFSTALFVQLFLNLLTMSATAVEVCDHATLLDFPFISMYPNVTAISESEKPRRCIENVALAGGPGNAFTLPLLQWTANHGLLREPVLRRVRADCILLYGSCFNLVTCSYLLAVV